MKDYLKQLFENAGIDYKSEFIKEAFFDKDAYQRKREYAYRISEEGIGKIALYFAIKDLNLFDCENLTVEEVFDRYDEYEIDDDVAEQIEESKENYEEVFEPISELSHKRHEIHSTNARNFINGNCSDLLSEVGDSFSYDEDLIDRCNALNREYHLVDETIQKIDDMDIPTLDTDTAEEIIDNYGSKYQIEYDEETDEDELTNLAYNICAYEWETAINNWSEHIRSWFSKLNQKFDTDFPS